MIRGTGSSGAPLADGVNHPARGSASGSHRTGTDSFVSTTSLPGRVGIREVVGEVLCRHGVRLPASARTADAIMAKGSPAASTSPTRTPGCTNVDIHDAALHTVTAAGPRLARDGSPTWSRPSSSSSTRADAKRKGLNEAAVTVSRASGGAATRPSESR